MAKAATSAADFRLTGDKQLDAIFAGLPMKVQKQVLRPALRSAAKIVHAAAKNNAPVKTGALRRSLKVRAGKRTRKNLVRAVVQTGASDNLFKGKTYYGAFQEFGWKSGKRGSSSRRQISGKHYIQAAYDSTAATAKEQALEEIKKGIEFAAWEIRNNALS